MDALARDTCSVRVLLLCGCLFSPGLPCRGGRKTFCPGKFLESESSEWDITPAGAGCGSSLLSPFLLSHPVLLQCLCTEQLRPESQSHKEKPPLRFPLRSPLRLRAEQSAPNLQGSLEVGQAPLWESPVWVAGLGGRDPQAQGSSQVNPGAMEGCLWGEPQKVFWVWLPGSSIPERGR